MAVLKARKSFKSLYIASALLTLSACGGSSSGDDTPELSIVSNTSAEVSGASGSDDISIITGATIDGTALSIEQVNISVVTSDEPLTLNEDGSVSVAPMTAAGDYSLEYQVCLVEDTDECASGTVSVTVNAAVLIINADSVSELNGGLNNTNIINVITNDTLDGAAINPEHVSVTVVEKSPELQLLENQISLNENTLSGDYVLTYQVCEILNPENCAQSNVSVNVDKGVFMNGVQGVKYESDSASGFTDEQGGFVYSAGDNISFHIGGTPLGEEVVARANLTPVNLITDATLPLTALETRKFLLNYDNNSMPMATQALLNVLTLLVSLDKDKDASNGIVIDEAADNALAVIDLNIYQNTYQFSGDQLTVALHKAFKLELVDNASKPEFFLALDHYYNLMNLTPEVYSVSKDWSYRPGDETTYMYEVDYDQENHQVTWGYFEVDADNKEIEGSRGKDVDIYDHNLVYSGWEYYEGDVLISSGIYLRDVHGNEISYQDMSDEEGVTYQTSSSYNELGLLSNHKRDSQGDDFYEYSVNYEYDANGNRTKKELDNDGDGDFDSINLYTYTNGLLTKQQDVWDADYDENAINVIDFERTYTYNEFGEVSKRVEKNLVNSSERVYDFIFDENGNRIFTYIDDNPEVEGYNQIITFTYDERGNTLGQYSDSNGDGINEYGFEYQYDEMNNRISQTDYKNRNFDTPSRVFTYTYDAIGNQLTREADNNGDGTINFAVQYIYNENGNLIEQRMYSGAIADSEPTSYYFAEYKLTNFKEWYVKGY